MVEFHTSHSPETCWGHAGIHTPSQPKPNDLERSLASRFSLLVGFPATASNSSKTSLQSSSTLSSFWAATGKWRQFSPEPWATFPQQGFDTSSKVYFPHLTQRSTAMGEWGRFSQHPIVGVKKKRPRNLFSQFGTNLSRLNFGRMNMPGSPYKKRRDGNSKLTCQTQLWTKPNNTLFGVTVSCLGCIHYKWQF